VLLSACLKPDQDRLQQQNGLAYFDLKGFVAQQAAQLSEQGAGLSKNIVVNGQAEQIELRGVAWEKELRPFTNADINKPVLVGAYTVSSPAEGKTVYEAISKDREVKRIIVLKEKEEVVSIEVDFSEDNVIYNSMRAMKMELKEGKLLNYQVSGFQKLRLDDTLRYELTASVRL
jgi:hypothetical protein